MRFEKLTHAGGTEVLTLARDFFGPRGLGLRVSEASADSIVFHGGGGLVDVRVRDAGAKTAVEVLSEEWDDAAEEFLDRLAA